MCFRNAIALALGMIVLSGPVIMAAPLSPGDPRPAPVAVAMTGTRPIRPNNEIVPAAGRRDDIVPVKIGEYTLNVPRAYIDALTARAARSMRSATPTRSPSLATTIW